MNVKLNFSAKFAGIFVIENRMHPNTYYCDIEMITATDNSYYQNIAFERVTFFINEILNNSLFIHKMNPKLKELSKLSQNVVLLPEEPYDQIIGFSLFNKLNAIMEQNIFVNNIKISSEDGGKIAYTIDEMDELTIFDTSKRSWWHKSDLSTCKNTTLQITWEMINLEWDPIIEYVPEEIEINTGNISTQVQEVPDEIIKKPGKKNKFSPIVILGGLKDNEDEY